MLASEIQPEEVKKIIDSIPKKIKEDVMTTYAKIQNQERQIGIQKNQVEVVLASFEDGILISQIASFKQQRDKQVP